MDDINLSDAKARLSELVAQAEAGDIVRITRHGRPVAQLVPVRAERRRIVAAELQAITDAMPYPSDSAGDFLRKMRGGDRY